MSAEQDQDQAFLKSFGIIMLMLAIIAVCSFFGARLISAIAEPHGGLPEQSLLAQKRTAPVYHVVTDASAIEKASASGSAAGGGSTMSGEEVFKATCHTCHVPGVLGAPKLTDTAEWEKRFSEQGLDELYTNAIDGIGNMPPKGGNASLTKDEMHAAVDFILSKAGVKAAAAADKDDSTSKGEAASDDSGDDTATDADADAADTTDSTGDNDAAATDNAAGDEASNDQAAAGAIDEDAANTTGKKVFEALCQTCHVPGIAGAPKVDDTAEWESRLSEQGLDKLHYSAIHGLGAMPPKGGNASLSDAEVEAAVNYMLLQSGAE